MVMDRIYHESAIEDARNAAITRTVEAIPTSESDWRVHDDSLRQAAIDANAQRAQASPSDNIVKIKTLHALKPGVRERIARANRIHPTLTIYAETRDGVGVMMSEGQDQQCFQMRKTEKFASMSHAEIIALLNPEQVLDWIVPPGTDANGFVFTGEIESPASEILRLQQNVSETMASVSEKIRRNALDTQVGGKHYKDMAIQPIEFIEKNQIPYLEGNAIKYICRHASKGGVQDIDKAIHYLQLLKEMRYGDSK